MNANASLIRYLSRSLNIPSSKVEIAYGARDRVKVVLVRDVSRERLVKLLEELLSSQGA